jgi:hypothetical protein
MAPVYGAIPSNLQPIYRQHGSAMTQAREGSFMHKLISLLALLITITACGSENAANTWAREQREERVTSSGGASNTSSSATTSDRARADELQARLDRWTAGTETAADRAAMSRSPPPSAPAYVPAPIPPVPMVPPAAPARHVISAPQVPRMFLPATSVAAPQTMTVQLANPGVAAYRGSCPDPSGCVEIVFGGVQNLAFTVVLHDGTPVIACVGQSLRLSDGTVQCREQTSIRLGSETLPAMVFGPRDCGSVSWFIPRYAFSAHGGRADMVAYGYYIGRPALDDVGWSTDIGPGGWIGNGYNIMGPRRWRACGGQ